MTLSYENNQKLLIFQVFRDFKSFLPFLRIRFKDLISEKTPFQLARKVSFMEISPSIFIGHGSPMTAIETGSFQTDLINFAQSLKNVNSILVVSAHWEQSKPLQIISAPKPELIYDFYGFPDELYRLKYSVSGNPDLAKHIAKTLERKGFETYLNPDRGLDHGSWIPLSIMFPEASFPVLQLSIPIPRTPQELFKMGKALGHYRKEGILLMGSGNLIHNLGHVAHQVRVGSINYTNFSDAPVEEWARMADNWIKGKLNKFQIKDLLDSHKMISNFKMVAPTTEHYDPLYFILGTKLPDDPITHFHESIQAGSISMRCFALGN